MSTETISLLVTMLLAVATAAVSVSATRRANEAERRARDAKATVSEMAPGAEPSAPVRRGRGQ